MLLILILLILLSISGVSASEVNDTNTGDSISNLDDSPNDNLINTSIKGEDTNIGQGAGEYYIVNLTDENNTPISGEEIIFNINNCNYTRITNENGTGSLKINLNCNSYNISYGFAGNENYTSCSGSSQITVIQYNSTITSPGLEMIVGTKQQFEVTLTDKFNNPISNAEINIIINNVTYKRTTDSEGIGKITINLNVGIYNISYYYLGNRTYLNSTGANSLIVRNYYPNETINTIINGDDTLIAYKAGESLIIRLTDSNNTPLLGQKITITVNNVDYQRTTDENGTGSLKINLGKGNYVVSYKFDGYGPLLASNGQLNLIVKEEETYLIGEDLELTERVYGNFQLTLTNENNKTLPNTFVNINLENKSYSQFTDINGKITIPLNLTSGIYLINYSFNGNISYQFSKGSNIINVKNNELTNTILNRSTIIFNQGNGEYFITTLTDMNNNPLSGQTVYYVINGVTYSRTTDTFGESKIKINLVSGNYKISYYYNGSENYNSYSNFTTITVKTTTKLNGNDVVYQIKNTNYYNVTLTDINNNPLINQLVTYNINNVNYNKYTDSEGKASIAINLNLGTYTIGYNYGGNENYSLSQGSSTITIINTTPTTLSGIDIYMVNGEDRSYIVHLEDKNGHSVSGGVIDISVDYYTWTYYIVEQDWKYTYQFTKNYQVTTDSEGNGYLPVTFGQGRYMIHSTFNGNDYYESSENYGDQIIVVGLSEQNGQGNEAYNGGSLSPYLYPTSNVESSNPKIKALAESLTAGIDSVTEQINAIYEYVRYDIEYELYSNTRYGALGTLERGSGNCVDQAHLIVAIARAAGIPARHVQGANHVWAQVLNQEKGVWLIADPTTERCWGLGVWNIYSILDHYA